MRPRRAIALGVLGLALAAATGGAAGCRDHATERGLAPTSEPAVPADKKELRETEKQRDQQVVNEIQKQEDKRFDAAEDR